MSCLGRFVLHLKLEVRIVYRGATRDVQVGESQSDRLWEPIDRHLQIATVDADIARRGFLDVVNPRGNASRDTLSDDERHFIGGDQLGIGRGELQDIRTRGWKANNRVFRRRVVEDHARGPTHLAPRNVQAAGWVGLAVVDCGAIKQHALRLEIGDPHIAIRPGVDQRYLIRRHRIPGDVGLEDSSVGKVVLHPVGDVKGKDVGIVVGIGGGGEGESLGRIGTRVKAAEVVLLDEGTGRRILEDHLGRPIDDKQRVARRMEGDSFRVPHIRGDRETVLEHQVRVVGQYLDATRVAVGHIEESGSRVGGDSLGVGCAGNGIFRIDGCQGRVQIGIVTREQSSIVVGDVEEAVELVEGDPGRFAIVAGDFAEDGRSGTRHLKQVGAVEVLGKFVDLRVGQVQMIRRRVIGNTGHVGTCDHPAVPSVEVVYQCDVASQQSTILEPLERRGSSPMIHRSLLGARVRRGSCSRVGRHLSASPAGLPVAPNRGPGWMPYRTNRPRRIQLECPPVMPGGR